MRSIELWMHGMCKVCNGSFCKRTVKQKYCSRICFYKSLKGRESKRIGIPRPTEVIEKIKKTKRAKPYRHTEEIKKKLSNIGRGRTPWNKGKKTGLVPKTAFKPGDKHSQWQGGISFEPYGIEFNSKLKKQIRKRDNYSCQECGYTEKKLGYILSIHHIDYDKKNCEENNLISLCNNCHSQTNFNRNDWTNYFNKKIK